MSLLSSVRRGVQESRLNRSVVCWRCGLLQAPSSVAKGSFAVELILWIVFFPIGILYSIWRLSTKRSVCTECGCDEMVPYASSAGREAMKRRVV